MRINELLQKAVTDGASDIFIIAGLPISFRKNGALHHLEQQKLLPPQTEVLLQEIYTLANGRDFAPLSEGGDDDFAFAIPGLSRFRVNAFKQRGSFSAVIRVITFQMPDAKAIGIPEAVLNMSNYSSGMVLVTGPAGSGKSTTLACMINQINTTREKHIITLEDPIEYLHSHKKSIVSQREISVDTVSYIAALRAALRQSPDVILLGEMRDYETIDVAMTAAETGHLLLSTLHTSGAASTIDRIIDVFPANQQHQISIQLASSLRAVISQQLVPTVTGEIVPAFEVMTITPAIKNMIREKKTAQIDAMLYPSSRPDMCSMDSSLYRLYKEKRITRDTMLENAVNPDMISRKG